MTKARISIDKASSEISLTGAVDQTTVANLWRKKPHLKSNKDYRLCLDQVTEIDSAGLALIINLKNMQQSQGGKIIIQNSSPQLQQLVDLAELENFLD